MTKTPSRRQWRRSTPDGVAPRSILPVVRFVEAVMAPGELARGGFLFLSRRRRHFHHVVNVNSVDAFHRIILTVIPIAAEVAAQMQAVFVIALKPNVGEVLPPHGIFK